MYLKLNCKLIQLTRNAWPSTHARMRTGCISAYPTLHQVLCYKNRDIVLESWYESNGV